VLCFPIGLKDIDVLFPPLFFQTLLDRFDYDDEPEGGEEAKKDETPSVQSTM